MAGLITFFPVFNGDMTLLDFDNEQKVLIDINVVAAADDEDDDRPDVMTQLRDKLERDAEGRLFVDAFLLSHPDADHISGLVKHFHLGNPEEWNKDDDKIFIREMWSSPIVFHRASKTHTLCSDAKAWAKEARRRVSLFRQVGYVGGEGDRILILGEDVDGKTDDILDIVVKVGETFDAANCVSDGSFVGRLLSPLPPDEEIDEDALSKNDSSVIIRFSLSGDGWSDRCRLLSGGDAGVAIWKRLWQLHGAYNADWLSYDLLQTPHHCSWRSLSFDRWSEMGEEVKVDSDARDALDQARDGAMIISSSKPIKKDDSDPPHERAKREYVSIVGDDADRFMCTMEHWDDKGQLIEFEVKSSGTVKKTAAASTLAAAALGIGGTAAQARPHGRNKKTR